MITPIGLGTWAIGGGDWIFGWGPQTDAQSIATIRRAIERGINWIDTAAVYGLGHAETIVARALRGLSDRDRPYIFTACSLVWDELGNVSHSLRGQSIRREVEGSLQRLGVDRIDLYQLGWPANPCSGQRCGGGDTSGSIEEAWETMAALQIEGKVRFIGVSNCDVDELARLDRIAPVISLQAPYSLVRREIENRTLSFCDRQEIAVLAASPLGSGLLTGTMTPDRVCSLPHNDWRRRSASFHQMALTHAAQLLARLRDIGARLECTPASVAVAWALSHPAVTAAIAGARRPEQIDEIVNAASCALGQDEIAALLG
jgi:aryl-alcohol dehydrogenase-like predicted oxidoreductase